MPLQPANPVCPGTFFARPRLAFTLLELLVTIAIIVVLATLVLGAVASAKAKAYRITCLNNQRQLALTWHLYSADTPEQLASNGYGNEASLSGTKLWVVGDTHTDPEGFTNLDFLIGDRLALFAQYLKTPRLYKCPADKFKTSLSDHKEAKARDYSMNSFLAWTEPTESFSDPSIYAPDYLIFRKASDLNQTSASETLLFLDVSPANLCNSAFVIGQGRRNIFYHLPSAQHSKRGVIAFTDGHVEAHRWEDPETVYYSVDGYVQDHSMLSDRTSNADTIWLGAHASIRVRPTEAATP